MSHLLAGGQTPESLASDRQRPDALLWNSTDLDVVNTTAVEHLPAMVD